MRISVIFNPAARGEKARRLRHFLEGLAHECTLEPTAGPGDARALARQAVRDGFDTIVGAGGDGTLNEVVNGIGDEPGGLDRVAFGVLPMGTANVFARELRLPLRPSHAWEIIRGGAQRQLDLIQADYHEAGRPVRRLAVQLAGAGLDARATQLVEWESKKRIGFLAYILAGFKGLCEAQPIITATVGESIAQGELVLMGNGRRYGGPFVAFPRADPRDGLLEIRVFPKADWRTAAACGWGVLTGRLGTAGRTEDFRASSVTLTASHAVPLELDGEAVGELPARLSILPQRLRVWVPAG